jgi:hypothetical protein
VESRKVDDLATYKVQLRGEIFVVVEAKGYYCSCNNSQVITLMQSDILQCPLTLTTLTASICRPELELSTARTEKKINPFTCQNPPLLLSRDVNTVTKSLSIMSVSDSIRFARWLISPLTCADHNGTLSMQEGTFSLAFLSLELQNHISLWRINRIPLAQWFQSLVHLHRRTLTRCSPPGRINVVPGGWQLHRSISPIALLFFCISFCFLQHAYFYFPSSSFFFLLWHYCKYHSVAAHSLPAIVSFL